MASKEIRTKIRIEKKNYDVIYKSHITGNQGTYEELKRGKFHDDDKALTPSQVEPVILRERTQKQDRRLIIDSEGWNKARCPYCHGLRITEFANRRESWELGNSYPVVSAKVDFGINRYPRRRETSKYCDSCERTYVKQKVVVAKY